MKKIVFIILATMLCFCINAQKCNTFKNQLWIDSVFKVNFEKMQVAVDSNLMYDTHVDRGFVYLLTYLSGKECSTINYFGFCYFDKAKLEEWIKWYESNKYQICKEKVDWALSVLHSENITQLQLDSLYNLRILR